MEEVFDKAYFTDALNSLFAELGPAQAMFGAASESPNVSALLDADAASSIVAFDMSISFGLRVENALSVFSGDAHVSPSLFFRLNNFGIFAEATVSSVDLDIFPGITVQDGTFALSAGVRIVEPFEGEVSLTEGTMASGIAFADSLKTIAFEPYGKLSSSLPFEATINDITQSLTIKLEDENIFDMVQFLVKVDFPVCPVVSIVDGLLGKLGSLGLSPKNILGPVETAGLDLSDTLDDYFPNLSQFIDGILEGALSYSLGLACDLNLSFISYLDFISFNTQPRMSFFIFAPKLPRLAMLVRC